MAQIEFTTYDPASHALFIQDTFREAFPLYKPEELERCMTLLEKKVLQGTVVLYDKDPAGFLIYKEYPRFFYCEYIAIAHRFRGNNLAMLLLSHVCDGVKQWIFEVETTRDYSTDTPKIRMFTRYGCRENCYPYEMPRVEEINPDAEYRIWSKFPMNRNEFDRMYDTLRNDPDF